MINHKLVKEGDFLISFLLDIASSTGVIIPLLLLCCIIIYMFVQIFKHSRGLREYNDSNKRIRTLLKNALAKTSGDRLMIMKFHGLNQKKDSIPYSSMSCIYEAFRDGMKPIKQYLVQVPTTLYAMFLKNLEDGYIILDPKQNTYEISEASYDYADDQDDSKGLYFMLNDMSSRLIGYISLKKASEITVEDVNVMSELVTVLTGSKKLEKIRK